jgi:hypothetical protein
MKKFILIFMLMSFPLICFSQDFQPTPTMQEKDNKEIYIPKNLDECFSELKKTIAKQQLEEFKNKKEEDAAIGAHFGLGMWIRNNWELWAKSQLAEYFNGLGVYHPDDMSSIILGTFWCHLNGKPLRLEERIKDCQEYWKYTTIPKDIVSPKDGAKIDFIMSAPCKDSNQPKNCTTHFGISQSDGLPWAYQYGKGVFEPSKEQKEEVLSNYKKLHPSFKVKEQSK